MLSEFQHRRRQCQERLAAWRSLVERSLTRGDAWVRVLPEELLKLIDDAEHVVWSAAHWQKRQPNGKFEPARTQGGEPVVPVEAKAE